MHSKRKRRTLLVALLAFVLATAAYAFTAANTVPDSYAGEGTGNISGFTVSNIEYTLDSNNPANITGVEFSLNQPANTVKATINNAAYTACTAASTPSAGPWTCNISSGVLAAAALKVVAAQ